jgi:hypothetical protein
MLYQVNFYIGGEWIFTRNFYASDLKRAKAQAHYVLSRVGPGWNARIEDAALREAGRSVFHIKAHGGRWKASELRFAGNFKPVKANPR